jgi:hypothetical protein
MRRIIYTALGAAALASASIANAAVTVTNSSGVNTPINTVNGATQSTIDWSANPVGTSFTGFIEFTNTLAGLYEITVQTSTPGGLITDAAFTGLGGSPTIASMTANTTNNITLGPVSPIDAGDYRVAFSGTTPAGGVATGNLTFQTIPVPEPATWALMILGFGGIGFALRRRRRPALAQLA